MPVWCVKTICRVGLLPFSFGLTHVHIPRWFDISHWVLNFLYLHTQVPVVFVYSIHRLNKVVIIRWVFSIGTIKNKFIIKLNEHRNTAVFHEQFERFLIYQAISLNENHVHQVSSLNIPINFYFDKASPNQPAVTSTCLIPYIYLRSYSLPG